jgi:hypothetical protein
VDNAFRSFFTRRVAPRLGLREPNVKKGHSRDIGVLGGFRDIGCFSM